MIKESYVQSLLPTFFLQRKRPGHWFMITKYGVTAFVMLLAGCATRPPSETLWRPRPAVLVVSQEVYFHYKPIMGWWNKAPVGRYLFQAEDSDYIYYRSSDGKVSYGSRFDAAKECEGGLALSKREEIIHVYVDHDYDESMKNAGELVRIFVPKPGDGRFRVPFGVLPASEREKVKTELSNPGTLQKRV